MAGQFAALTRRSVVAALPGMVLLPLIAGGTPMGMAAESMATIPDQSPPEPIVRSGMQLAGAIYDHCVAYSELGDLSYRTDVIVLGREPTPGEWQRVEAASDRERDLLMRLCAFPASDDAERHAKASYLLGIFDGDEPSSEHVTAILESMLEPVPTHPGRAA